MALMRPEVGNWPIAGFAGTDELPARTRGNLKFRRLHVVAVPERPLQLLQIETAQFTAIVQPTPLLRSLLGIAIFEGESVPAYRD